MRFFTLFTLLFFCWTAQAAEWQKLSTHDRDPIFARLDGSDLRRLSRVNRNFREHIEAYQTYRFAQRLQALPQIHRFIHLIRLIERTKRKTSLAQFRVGLEQSQLDQHQIERLAIQCHRYRFKQGYAYLLAHFPLSQEAQLLATEPEAYRHARARLHARIEEVLTSNQKDDQDELEDVLVPASMKTLALVAGATKNNRLLQSLLALGTRPYDSVVNFVIQTNQPDTLRLLLQFGASPHASPSFHPLGQASYFLCQGCVALLLEAGADPNMRAPSPDGNTPLQLAVHADTELHANASAESRNVAMDIVKLLLQYNANVTVPNTSGYYPMHFASTPEMVHLLQQYGDTVNVEANNGMRPIHMAVRMSSSAYLQALLDAGAELEPIISYHMNPIASFVHRATALDYFAREFTGNTPLMIAIKLHHVDHVRRLVAAGANVHAPAGTIGPPLHYASSREVYRLLRDNGASLLQRSYKGYFALHQAAHSGSVGRVVFLLEEFNTEMQANMVDIRSDDGETPLHLAARSNYPEVVQYLLVAGADVNAPDSHGWTPLVFALQSPFSETVVPLLLQAGASCDPFTRDGQNVMHYAAADIKVSVHVLELLLEAHGNPLVSDAQGRRAMDLCSDTDKLASMTRHLEMRGIYS